MSVVANHATTAAAPRAVRRPPGWLFAATGALGLLILVMAVAETNFWLHYLIDGGEYFSLAGLVSIAAVGFILHRSHRLVASLPLVVPWLLFPVITQGDQLIDNLSITPMRIITHVLLAAIFATPVGVIVLAARSFLGSGRVNPRSPLLALAPGLRPIAEGRLREGTMILAVALFALETLVAVAYLGVLMIATLVVIILLLLWWGSISPPSNAAGVFERRARSERRGLVLLLMGVAVSFGLYLGYKNRPGAYQGSPSFLMDPGQKDSGYPIGRVAVPARAAATPASAEALSATFTLYGQTLRRLLDGYYILDRNYTYDFHNELFVRYTPVLPGYRAAGLAKVGESRAMRADADAAADATRATLADDDPLAAFLEDVRAYVAFNFERAGTLEAMSGEFEQSKAGLQHAAHLYEGEGKVLGLVLADIFAKHQHVIEAPATAPIVAKFVADGRAMQSAYASRVVGF